LVDQGFKKVYRVLGIRDPLGYLVGARDPFSVYSKVLGMDIMLTLLPWNGDIVYDGLVVCGSRVSNGDVKRAIRAYVKAVDSGTLITSFARNKETVKLMKKPGTLKQKLLSQKSHYSGPNPDRLKVTLSVKLASLAALPLVPSETLWVFRRHGYSERENPHHGVTVLSASQSPLADPLVPYATLKALAPTVEEYIDLLLDACRQFNNRRPVGIAIDYLPIVQPTLEVLRSTRIEVHYYPPPSEEEEIQYNPHKQPHRTSRVQPTPPPRFEPGAKVCHLCTATTGPAPENEPLMQCSRCKKAWYCSREHQKIHWRVHKHECA
jgi:hypothetical protein